MGQQIDGEQRFRTKAATQGTEAGQRRPGRVAIVLAGAIVTAQELGKTARTIGAVVSETAKSFKEAGVSDADPKITSLTDRKRRSPQAPESDAL